MTNKYGLPEEDLALIRARDVMCVYCRKEMANPGHDTPRQDWKTIEHLNHLPPWDNSKTVAICCGSCNSSRGKRTILDWFKSKYCQEKNISPNTVALPVLAYIREFEGYNGE